MANPLAMLTGKSVTARTGSPTCDEAVPIGLVSTSAIRVPAGTVIVRFSEAAGAGVCICCGDCCGGCCCVGCVACGGCDVACCVCSSRRGCGASGNGCCGCSFLIAGCSAVGAGSCPQQLEAVNAPIIMSTRIAFPPEKDHKRCEIIFGLWRDADQFALEWSSILAQRTESSQQYSRYKYSHNVDLHGHAGLQHG